MKDTFKENMPRATRIKSWLLPAMIVFVIFILIIVMFGLSHNFSGKENKDNDQNNQPDSHAVHKTATDADILKLKKQEVADLSLKQGNNQQSENPNLLTSNNDEDTQKLMSASISTNQITGDQAPNTSNISNTSNLPAIPNASNQQTPDDPNMQSEKKDFLKVNSQPNPDDYLSSTVQNSVSKYELQTGTIIPGILITGINSDLPGQITGQVRSNVYDTISGNYLLIPQGSKVVGLYDSQVAYGQERVLVVWKRILFPNGKNIDLQGMPGADLSGYAGFNDQVNNHYVKIFSSVILMSLLSAGAQLSQPQSNSSVFVNNTPTVGQTLAQSLGTNIANTGTMITQKNLSIQPTLVIRPGYEFNISVAKDIVFPGAYVE